MTLCRLFEFYRRFWRTWYPWSTHWRNVANLPLALRYDWILMWPSSGPSSLFSSSLNFSRIFPSVLNRGKNRGSKFARNFYQTTRHHIPEYCNLHSHCREKTLTSQSNIHWDSRQCCHHAMTPLRALVPLLHPVTDPVSISKRTCFTWMCGEDELTWENENSRKLGCACVRRLGCEVVDRDTGKQFPHTSHRAVAVSSMPSRHTGRMEVKLHNWASLINELNTLEQSPWEADNRRVLNEPTGSRHITYFLNISYVFPIATLFVRSVVLPVLSLPPHPRIPASI